MKYPWKPSLYTSFFIPAKSDKQLSTMLVMAVFRTAEVAVANYALKTISIFPRTCPSITKSAEAAFASISCNHQQQFILDTKRKGEYNKEVGTLLKMYNLRGLLTVGGQCSIDSMGNQKFQNYCN